jgi:ribosomal protein S18 acetylase RimI-like enzyme
MSDRAQPATGTARAHAESDLIAVNITYRIQRFDADSQLSPRDLAQLHAALLPTSPITLLGALFMERFYYAILPREGLIFGAVAYVDERPVGFVAATHDSEGFMRSGLRLWWPYLVWVLGISVASSPRSIAAVWEAIRVMTSRRPAKGDGQKGEILSLGVLPGYREPQFVRHSRLRISNDLLETAVAQLSARSVRVIRAFVNANNTQTKLFYCGLGWTLNHTGHTGYRTPTVEFELQA